MSISRLIKVAATAAASLALSSAAYAGCNTGSYCGASAMPGLSNYSFQSSAMSYHQPAPQVVPFSTRHANVSNLSIAGMGPNERLCPTQCPVSVHNPEGGKVLGCYNVCKPVAPTVTPVHVQSYIRVVRPVIYVRYPVPTPVPVPVYLPAPAPAPVCGGPLYGPMPRPVCGY